MHLDTFFSVSQHTAMFLLSVVLGAALGVVYDCFRALRVIFPPAAKKNAVIAEDIIFWLIYGFCIFCYAASFARGQVRSFMFFGSLIGFVLYLVTVGSIVIGIIRSIFGTFYKILHKVYSRLIEPFVKIFKTICQKIVPLFVRNHKNAEIPERSVKNHLKNAVSMVYNKCISVEKNIRGKETGR